MNKLKLKIYRDILKKYCHPIIDDEQVLKIAQNIEALAQCFYKFELRSKKSKPNKNKSKHD